MWCLLFHFPLTFEKALFFSLYMHVAYVFLSNYQGLFCEATVDHFEQTFLILSLIRQISASTTTHNSLCHCKVHIAVNSHYKKIYNDFHLIETNNLNIKLKKLKDDMLIYRAIKH